MTLRLVQRARARQDVLELTAYIAADDPRAAARFYDAYERALAALVTMPDMGRRYSSSHPHLANVRMIPVGRFRNYLVFYRHEEDVLEILRILHGARDILAALDEGPRRG